MDTFTEAVFRDKLARAIDHLRLVLQGERRLKPPDQVPHQYDNKFALADQLTKMTVGAAFRVIRLLGQADDGAVARLRQWTEAGAQVTLRFQIESAMKFEEEVTRRENDGDERIVTHSSLFGTAKTTSKVVRVVTEYRHAHLFVCRLLAWAGPDPTHDALPLWTREIRFDQLLPNKTTQPSTPSIERHDVNISFLLALTVTPFAIDRQKPTCKTPRRNEDIDRALRQVTDLASWTVQIVGRLQSLLFDHLPEKPREEDMRPTSFCPVLPVFSEGSNSALLSEPDLQRLQSEHERLLKEKFADLDRAYANAATLRSEDVKRVLLLNQLHLICMAYLDSLAFIEKMLYDQLEAAVGKVVGQEDFDAFVRVHNRKLFREEFVPTPFCYAVRRPDHAPEGVITVRESNRSCDPILSQVRPVPLSYPISFPISAATMIPFEGDRFLHCCVFSDFLGEMGLPSLEISARACQFSNYILMVGTMTSARIFQPKSAIIVKDKDEVAIPLELSQLPSAKEFRDAIESLSPEQQRFCRAFRAMQLESSLFALCAIQIKPQLELVLGLPDDSLTKEIQLSQDLMELFMRYQIPSDLLSYNGDTSAPVEAKLDAVRQSVANIKQIIDEARSKRLSEAKQEGAFRVARSHPELLHDQPMRVIDVGLFDTAPMAPSMAPAMPAPAMPSMARYRAAAMPVAAPTALMSVNDIPRPAMATKSAASAGPSTGQPGPINTGQPGPSTGQPQRSQQQEHPDQGQDQVPFERDFTMLPSSMDRQLERLDKSGHLRPTRILLQSPWKRTRQESLLSEPVKLDLEQDEQDREKNAAFDLLDALSKSGSLPIKSASLHVLVALTHNFSHSLVETIIEENVNPIEALERSLLITASTLHQVQIERLIRPEILEQSRISSADLMQLDSIETAPYPQ